MYRLICQKSAHFLSAQMALVSTFFQMFIVLGMYNFAIYRDAGGGEGAIVPPSFWQIR